MDTAQALNLLRGGPNDAGKESSVHPWCWKHPGLESNSASDPWEGNEGSPKNVT